MATTTNYGWTTPDNTALVKDGASAIRTLGSSIDTSVKSLSPGTTAGDLDYYTSSTAKSRIAIGSTGQVLTVAGGVPTWASAAAGSMTSIASGSLSTGTVTLSSISGSYKELKLVMFGLSVTSNAQIFFRFNGASGGSDYSYAGFSTISTTFNSTGETAIFPQPSAITAAGTTNFYSLQFPNYASTTSLKNVSWNCCVIDTSNATGIQTFGAGTYRSSSAITSISINTNAGTFDAGTYILYGVN